MKKSLLALAVLGAFAGTAATTASAQSSVTIYGIVDANLGKDISGSNCTAFATTDCDVFDRDSIGAVVNSATAPALAFT